MRGFRYPRALLSWVAVVQTAEIAAAFEMPEIHGRVGGYGVVRFDRDSPRQLPQANIHLDVLHRLTSRWTWGLSLIGRWGGPPEDASAGVFDWSRSFQNLSPSLEIAEAYADYRGDDFDLRVGLQKFAWGRLDSLPLSDLLNPRQYEDPFLLPAIDQKIGVPAIAGSYALPAIDAPFVPEESRLSLVWEPIAVPWRFPLLGERWFPPAGLTEGIFRLGPLEIPVEQTLRNSDPPARRFDNGNVGLRIDNLSGGVDWSLSYYDGYDPTPAFVTPLRVFVEPDTIRVETELVPEYVRFRSIGADLALVYEGFTIRAAVAGQLGRPYPRDLREVGNAVASDPDKVRRLLQGETVVEPGFVIRDAIDWGIGVDLPITDYVAILELSQMLLIGNDEDLLVRDVDTTLVATARRQLLDDRLGAEVSAIWSFESGAQLLLGRLSYAWTDEIEVWGGLLGLWGSRRSLIGQFRDNDQAFLGVSYSF